METKNYCIQLLPTLHFLTTRSHRGTKTRLMITRPNISRFIKFAFIVLVGCALIYGIRARSVTGIVLSLTSLGAGIHFMILLTKARQQMEQEQEEAI